MQGNCILTSGLLFATLSLAIAKHKQSSFTKSCHPRGTLSQAVDMLYVKTARLKATIPEDSIKNIRLLKKKSKKLFMKNCRFQEQLLSFFMEDVFGQLQVRKAIQFVEEFHSLRQKLSRCNATSSDVGNGGHLFLDILTNWKGESDIKIIQSQIVSFYFKLFDNIEDNKTIQNSLDIIKEELRVKVFNSSNSKMEDFKKLIQTPVNDQRVQRKAISELFNVITELSKSNSKMRKRRQNLFRGWRASK
ncbi:Interleukin-26 [Myotis brandtii]|uniref:Interferon gamma n=1 Tax=Myotis brandtii TaxID=109478 RepID=S7MEP8_MYOBR|nr:Interleukin-26 [Myotis brandtii]